jgi:L-malate glycosyltransferase
VSRKPALHQLIGLSSPGHSVADYALALQDALHAWGYDSTIFASDVDPRLKDRVRPLHTYRAKPNQPIILHYALANEASDWAKKQNAPLIFCYHNITPAHFFTGVGGTIADASERGKAELTQFQPQTRLALAYSQFSATDLQAANYQNIQVIPLLMSQNLQESAPDPNIQRRHTTNLLFVGRVSPNKKCEDLIKILHQYRQIEPDAHLFIVGARRYMPVYAEWLAEFVADLGLQEAVTFTGHVSLAELAAYYRMADVYISMSEHEGFGIPLVESMRFDLPIIAYDCTAVPELLGGSGILIKQKRFDVIAELIHQIQTDAALRQKIIQQQQQQAKKFAPELVLAQMRTLIEQVANP